MSAESLERVENAWLIRRAVEAGIGYGEWVALYADLYRQTHGEGVSPEEIASDAVWRQSVIATEVEGRGIPAEEEDMHLNPFTGKGQWMTQARKQSLDREWYLVGEEKEH